MRCFVCIKVPEEIRRELEVAANLLRGIRGVSLAKEFHITLKFLGEIDTNVVEMVKARLEEVRYRRFKVEVRGLGFFPNRKRMRVIWAGAHSKELNDLAFEVDSALEKAGFTRERFSPHITLARIKNFQEREKIGMALSKILIKPSSFSVSSFFLERSELKREGPCYSDIAEFKLSE
ncbi:MAG: RNA 2',3'-cyclic phosphodiesterase [Candidatus Woesearchaeota archaeon]